MATIKKAIKKALKPKVEVIKDLAPVIPFSCGACNKTGLDRITHDVCSECNGTPERGM